MKSKPTILIALKLALLCSSIQNLYAYQAPEPGTIVTVVGTGRVGFSGDGGPATQATLHYPFGLSFDAAGNLFIADWGNYRVRKVSPDGIITTVAGTGKPGFSGEGGPAASADLRGPLGVAVDPRGNLWISDSAYASGLKNDNLPLNERVLKIVGVAAPGLLAGQPFP
jgi:DNA-binding beta-propeller fold protein YncE